MFYKIIPNNENKKASFVYIEHFNEDMKQLVLLQAEEHYYAGAKDIVLANTNDIDFINYIKADIEVVNKEIANKKLLLSRLNNVNKSLK